VQRIGKPEESERLEPADQAEPWDVILFLQLKQTNVLSLSRIRE
jgi:hypothetical protein